MDLVQKIFLMASALLISSPIFANASLPERNFYLATDILAITHVDPAATDSFPFTLPKGTFHIDLQKTPQVVGGPVNIMTLASTSSDYMWGVSSGGVTYIDTRENHWKALARAIIPNIQPVTDRMNQEALGQPFRSVADVAKSVRSIYKMNGFDRISNGVYSLVDNKNTLYANYAGHFIYAFALNNPHNPNAGIKIRSSMDFNRIPVKTDPKERVTGLSMTYDGHIIVLGNRSLSIVDKGLNKILDRIEFDPNEYISNSVAVDKNNGIYVASDKMMRKVIWTGSKLSMDEKDGAWRSPYETGQQPPVVKIGTGTGSTPTLMGFDNDSDKLVVITDGANRMHLVGFWRNEIPSDFKQQPGTLSRRIAGQIPVTCGFNKEKLPTFIQSEQSVVVKNYGAFVVNNIGKEGSKDLLIGVMALGPVFPPPRGVERFEWDTTAHHWRSVWANSAIVSTSMVPVVSIPSNMVLVNGYTKEDGWEVTGLDWNTGKVVHRTLFGHTNYGNGAYALIELIGNNDMVFNSIAGPYRIQYK